VDAAKADWAYANNARMAMIFMGLALVLLAGFGILAGLGVGQEAAFAASALLTLAIFLLAFSALVFLPRWAQRGPMSFSVYSDRSMDEAEAAVRAAIEASGRTPRIERLEPRAGSPSRIVTAEGIPARFRIQITRHPTSGGPGPQTEIIEVVPQQEGAEARALRQKVAEQLALVPVRDE
jgi:hypothetical protein